MYQNQSMTLPTISIVTPSFNQVDFLESTLKSVLDQNYPKLEYIVMDGGSSDGSAEMIASYADRLSYWQSEKDGGQYDAIQQGFDRSTGEIMAWLNADDLYFPWTLQVVGEIFATYPDVEWLISLNPGNWNERGILCGTTSREGYTKVLFDRGLLLRLPGRRAGHFIQQESVFWRRRLWDRAGGRLSSEHRLAADFELWARFFQQAPPYGVKAVLSGFRRHGQQRSQVLRDQYFDELYSILKDYGAKIEPGWLSAFRRSPWFEKLPFLCKLGLADLGKTIYWDVDQAKWERREILVCR
jgi:glycosyltransferase involved in cell wall biosynthesis